MTGLSTRLRALAPVLALTLVVTAQAGLLSPHPATAATAGQDWPTWQHDAARSGLTGGSTLSPANVPGLARRWSTPTGTGVTTSPAIVGGVGYAGASDGYEYAFNLATGAVVWRTSLGLTSNAGCSPATPGVTSSATVDRGVVYAGGGDSDWYALDAVTGAIRWHIPIGDGSQPGAHHNWSSPLIVGNAAYIGVASNCDATLVQGRVLRVDLTTHTVTAAADLAPAGQTGAGVRTSPAYDPLTGTVFVSTGMSYSGQPLANSIVAIDATTMAVRDHWQVPVADRVGVSDWGSSPTLLSDGGGRPLLAAANKNGVLYAFDRTGLAAGPVWHARIARGGNCPQCGDGSISSGVADNGVLYYAGGDNLDPSGIGHHGSVSAFSAATGGRLWYHATSQTVQGALAEENGVLLAVQGSIVEAVDAVTGRSIWDYQLGSLGTAGVAIGDGVVVLGTVDGVVQAFAPPAVAPPPPAPDATCPAGWTCRDVGTGVPRGAREAVNPDGSWTVTAGGTGIHGGGGPDQTRLITQDVTGDNQMVAQVLGQSVQGSLPQAGTIERASADPGAPFYAAFMFPNDPSEHETQPKIVVEFRRAWGQPRTELTKVYPLPYPRYSMITRHGDVFNAAFSDDGRYWNLIPGTQTTVVTPATLMVGLGVNSGASMTLGTARFAHVGVVQPASLVPHPKPTAHPCPTGWQCGDTDDLAPQGDQQFASGVWTLNGAGWDVGNAPDDLHYAMQPLAGNATVTAQVTSIGASSPGAKAGVMVRQTTDPGSPFYAMLVTSGQGGLVQWRTLNGINDRASVPLPAVRAPAYLRISRYTDTSVTPNVTYFSAYSSADGTAWTLIAGSTQAIAMGGGPVLAGLVGTTNKPVTTNPSTFAGVAITGSAVAPPLVCPSGFTGCADIGAAAPAGTQEFDGATLSVRAGGGDIWSAADQFHLVWRELGADGSVTARVVSQEATSPWAKAGVMVRASADPGSPYYALLVTPGNGIVVQYRSVSGGTSSQVQAPGRVPLFVRVARSTDGGGATSYSAFTSADGVVWVSVPGSTRALTMPGTVLAGWAAASHSQTVTGQVVFDNLAVAAGTPASTCPVIWSCIDVGGATPAGGQSVSGGLWSIAGGGGDISNPGDEFHFVGQPLPGDGAIRAHVARQEATDPWAKAGVMLRVGSDPLAPYYAILVTPGHGLVVQYRADQGGVTSYPARIAGASPLYVAVARTGTAVTASTSADGKTWTVVANSPATLPGLGGAVLAGLAVTSHATTRLSSVSYDSVVIG